MPRRYYAELEGLRGLAAVNVALAHFSLAFVPVLLKGSYPDLVIRQTPEGFWVDLLRWPPLAVFFNGHFAVMVFFVLSGYVITQPAFEGDPRALLRRLAGRYLRLNGPILITVWLSFLLAHLGAYANIAAGDRWGSAFFESHFRVLPSLGETLTASLWGTLTGQDLRLDPPLWSLRIEWFGSLALLLVYSGAAKSQTLWAALIAAVLLALAPGEDRWFYFFLWAGAQLPRGLGLEARYRLWSWLPGLAGLFLGAYTPSLTPYQSLPDLWGLLSLEADKKTFYNGLGGLLLVWAVLLGFGAAWLKKGLFQWLGQRAYALYLVHFLWLASGTAWLSLRVPVNGFGLSLLLLAYLGGGLLLSQGFTRWVDRVFIRMGRGLGQALFG